MSFLYLFTLLRTWHPLRVTLEINLINNSKKLITKFADVTEEPQGLPPHRGHLDHKVKLTSYLPRQRRNRLSVHEYEELQK